MDPKTKSHKVSKYCTLLGGFLLLFPVDFGVMWGNMSVYVFSRIWHDSGTTAGLQTPWVLSSFVVFWNIGCLFAGLIRKADKRLIIAFGVVSFNGSIFACYFFIRLENAPILFILVGGMVGFGTGILDCTVCKLITNWSDQRHMGFEIFLGFSGSAIGDCVFNPLITEYINPDNVSPTVTIGHLKLFTDEDIIDRVPSMFLVFGGASLASHIFGILLLRENESRKESSDRTSAGYGTVLRSGDYATKNEHNVAVSSLETNSSSTSIPDGGITQTLERDDQILFDTDSSLQQKNGSSFKDILKSPSFYSLWFTFLCMEFMYVHQGNYYKEYGQRWIKDDHFLTSLAMFMGLCCGVIGVFWGSFVDKVGVKTCLVVALTVGVIFPFVVYFMAMVDRWLYLISMTILYCVRGTLEPTLLIATNIYFDKERSSSNFGLLTSGGTLVNFIAPPLFSYLLKTYNWFSSFAALAVFNLAALLVLVIFFNDKRL